MQPHSYVALVTIAALLVYIWMGVRVGQARAKSGVAAPAMTGDPILERHIRVHYNTLEWLPIFLAGLWLFAIYWNDLFAAGLGLSWLATVPPTAGLVGKLFGPRYLGTLFGLTLLTHQIGGFFGAWLGGVALEHSGSYQWMWYADIVLALLAAAANLPIRERALEPVAA